MKLTINGNVPSQKNRKIISQNRATGRPFLRSAPAVKAWQAEAELQLRAQFKGYQVTDYPITITVVIFWDSLRRHDLDNGLSSIMDALSSAEIIPDDNVNYVECVTVSYGGHDKEHPRAEIYIDD